LLRTQLLQRLLTRGPKFPGRPGRSGSAAHAKILVNFSAATPDRALPTPADIRGMISILRAVERHAGFGRFSIVAVSVDNQQVLYRQSPQAGIDYHALGRALSTVRWGTVDIRQLANPVAASDFLAATLTKSIGPESDPPDAVIVISPNVWLERNDLKQRLPVRASESCPVFYLNYNPDLRAYPWRGALSAALKRTYHALEYTIARPRDLQGALKDISSRVAIATAR
jgi:hypothetical protein